MKVKRLSQCLTFEQLKAYADRMPSLEGCWIYRLEHVRMDDDACYPEFKVGCDEYWFLSHSDAELFIRNNLLESACTYSFIIPSSLSHQINNVSLST